MQKLLHARWRNRTRSVPTKLSEKEQSDLKEKIITAVKQRPNYQGKPLGSDLPRYVKKWAKLQWITSQATGKDYVKDIVLADFALDQVLVHSRETRGQI